MLKLNLFTKYENKSIASFIFSIKELLEFKFKINSLKLLRTIPIICGTGKLFESVVISEHIETFSSF